MKASELLREIHAIINHTGDADVLIDAGIDEDNYFELKVEDIYGDGKAIWLEAR